MVMTIDTANLCSHLHKKLFEPEGVYYPIWQTMQDDEELTVVARSRQLHIYRNGKKHGAYGMDGFRKHSNQFPCADSRLHHPRFRNRHGGEVRLRNHAWRGNFHCHSQGDRLAIP